MVLKMDGRWPYSCCFVGYCLEDVFNTARCILVQLAASFFSIRLVSVHVVYLYSSIDTTAAWKKNAFYLSDRSYFHMTDSLSIAVHTFANRVLVIFRRWDASSEWGEFVHKFQRLDILGGDVASLVIAHDLCFVCVDIEACAACCPFQTMQQEFGVGKAFQLMLKAESSTFFPFFSYQENVCVVHFSSLDMCHRGDKRWTTQIFSGQDKKEEKSEWFCLGRLL